MSATFRALLFCLVAWAGAALPQTVANTTPFVFESATVVFAPGPNRGAITLPDDLLTQVVSLGCAEKARADPSHHGTDVTFECILVRRKESQLGLMSVFARMPGWGMPLEIRDIRGGNALWRWPVPFPIALWALALLFGCLMLALIPRHENNWSLTPLRSQPLWPLGLPLLVAAAHPAVFALMVGNSVLDGACSLTRAGGIYILFMTLVLAPLVEEIIYRGWAFSFLRRSFSLPVTTTIISVVFAAVHYGSVADPGSLIRLFFISVALCYLRHRTGSILACVIAHVLVNLLATIIKAC